MELIKLIEKRSIARKSMEFTFAKPADFTFEPGQFVEINVEHPGEPEKKRSSRELSIVSAPHEDVLAFAMRMRGSPFKRTLSKMETGDEVTIDGPFGAFLLQNDTSRPAVFLAGGVGIAPFLSMIRHAMHCGLPHEMYLFYSNHTKEDAPYLDELAGISRENKNFTYIPTLTTGAAMEAWKGLAGRITAEMIAGYISDFQMPIFYSAGSAAMVTAMKKLLNDAGVRDDNIRTEEFTGYA
jgi:ferredoxin-NADP reductase